MGHAVFEILTFENSFPKIKQNNKWRNRSFSLKISALKSKNRWKKTKKIVLNKYNVKNFESLITQKLHERDENFFLLFEADEIAFDIKYVIFHGGSLIFKLTSFKFEK